MVKLNRKRGGEDGIYRCEIDDARNVIQRIYIGVYTASTGEWHCTLLFGSTVLQYIYIYIMAYGSYAICRDDTKK